MQVFFTFYSNGPFIGNGTIEKEMTTTKQSFTEKVRIGRIGKKKQKLSNLGQLWKIDTRADIAHYFDNSKRFFMRPKSQRFG